MSCRLVKLCEFQLRRSTALEWTADSGTILGAGEPGFESDTFKLKIGDGIRSWANLPYIGSLNLSTSPNNILWSSDGTSVTGSTGFSYTPGVSGNVKLEGDFLPSIDSVYSLGVTGQAWKDLHLGKSTISADNDGVLIFTKADGTIDTRIGTTGATGSTGTNGVTGVTGANGTDGTNGLDGVTGVTGATGTNGTNGVTGVTGVTGLTGATGIDGTNGVTGVTGATGTNGLDGVTGVTGATGTNGVAGPTGPTGNTTAYIFDGGNSSSSYFLGPAFDCGSSI